jgi:hypothetical protein
MAGGVLVAVDRLLRAVGFGSEEQTPFNLLFSWMFFAHRTTADKVGRLADKRGRLAT